jgi:hypothetical protein
MTGLTRSESLTTQAGRASFALAAGRSVIGPVRGSIFPRDPDWARATWRLLHRGRSGNPAPAGLAWPNADRRPAPVETGAGLEASSGRKGQRRGRWETSGELGREPEDHRSTVNLRPCLQGQLVTVRLCARPRRMLEGTGAPDRTVPGRGMPVCVAQAAARARERHLGRRGPAAGIKVSCSLELREFGGRYPAREVIDVSDVGDVVAVVADAQPVSGGGWMTSTVQPPGAR